MAVISAGVLVYRRRDSEIEFLLGHPGGPLWAHKDLGAWMIFKGLIEPGEDPLAAALREFAEETGLALVGDSALSPLRTIRQAGGKSVMCWSAEADLDLAAFSPGLFEMEWPPRSGRRASFPEVDRIAYFEGAEALRRILPSQAPLIDEALTQLAERGSR